MRANKKLLLLAVPSLGIMLAFSAPYLTMNPSASRIAVDSSPWQYPLLVVHIGFALIALIAGFLQFSGRIRSRRPSVHRLAGRIYVVCVALGGLTALGLTAFIGNFPKAVSFLTLAAAWLFATWKGWDTARRKDFGAHRVWMMRSMAVTLVAVSGRAVMPVLLIAYAAMNGFSLPDGREGMVEEALNVNIWVGLVLNLLLVEWALLKPRRLGDGR